MKTAQLKRVTKVAAELGISRDCILQAIALGHLPARRLGIGPTAPWYLTDEDVAAWLDSRKVARRAW